MASRRKEHQEDAKVRVLQLISTNPQMSSRELAYKLGISHGSAYYLLTSLLEKGFIKLSNFKENSQKKKYSYLLTPKGIRKKTLITRRFLIRKKQEFEALKDEINILANMQLEGNAKNIPKSIINKAKKHAKQRLDNGLNPFYQDNNDE